jgi:hypothetical protein
MVNIAPEYWGRCAWIFLHSITMAYPDNPTDSDKLNYKNFFNSMKHVLPCHKCRINYSKHLISFPLTDRILSSRERLIDWIILIRNQTNRMNNKSLLTYDDVVDQIQKMHALNYESQSFSMKNLYFRYTLMIAFVFIVGYLIAKPLLCKNSKITTETVISKNSNVKLTQ